MAGIPSPIQRMARSAQIVLNKTGNSANLSKRQRAALLIVELGGPLSQDFADKAKKKNLLLPFQAAWSGMISGKIEWAPDALKELKDKIEEES